MYDSSPGLWNAEVSTIVHILLVEIPYRAIEKIPFIWSMLTYDQPLLRSIMLTILNWDLLVIILKGRLGLKWK